MELSLTHAWAKLVDALSVNLPADEVQTIGKWLLEAKFNVPATALALRNANVKIDAVAFEGFLTRLVAHEPIQYIIGEVPFFDCLLKVAPGVLIPRPETEELAYRIVQENPPALNRVIWDICSGSGCIAISLQRHLKAKVFGFELSDVALEISRQNAALNKATVTFVKQDIFSAQWGSFEQPHLIVSNPPYVMEREKAEMQENVLRYEPAQALFVPDDDALIFYEELAEIGLRYLLPGGILYLEINAKLALETQAMLQKTGYGQVVIWHDWSGKPRFMKASK